MADDLRAEYERARLADPNGDEPPLDDDDYHEGDADQITLSCVTLADFAAVEEAGVDALLGGDGEALIPANGDVMVYGDGGAGKTTLCLDLGCHLAAGDDWLGIPIAKAISVLLVENEGPRPLFRAKARAKLDAWAGSPLDDRVRIVDEPWATFTFAAESHRVELARRIADHDVDVVIVGPLVTSGMLEAGTLQEVRRFLALCDDVRRRAERTVTFILIHHENKGGKVSGSWEGAGDTLVHVAGHGPGMTRVHIQKARWASSWHSKTLELRLDRRRDLRGRRETRVLRRRPRRVDHQVHRRQPRHDMDRCRQGGQGRRRGTQTRGPRPNAASRPARQHRPRQRRREGHRSLPRASSGAASSGF